MGFKGMKNHKNPLKCMDSESQIFSELHKYVRILYFVLINSIEK